MTSITCKQAISKALEIQDNGMSESELSFLAEFCVGKCVLELGSYVGKSSMVIASVAKELTCVDAWINGAPFLDEEQSSVYKRQNLNMEKLFDENMQDFSNVKKLKRFIEDVAHIFTSVDVILVDSDHSYLSTKKTIQLYLPKSEFFFFHDYGGCWEGVKRAVDEELSLTPIRLVHTLLLTNKHA